MIIWDSDFEMFVKIFKEDWEVYGHLVRNLGFFG